MLTREIILATPDLPTEKVPVPEWDGEVFVRTLTGAERDSFEQSIVDEKKESGDKLINIRAKLAARCVCDEQGNRIFTDDDIEALGKKSGKALDRLFSAAQRLSGIGASEVKELEKNS